MDALEFVKQLRRMDKTVPRRYSVFDDSPEDVVAEVEEWAKMNPVKTRQSVFLEQCPDAIISDDELPEVAPCQLCAGLIHGGSVEDCENRGLCVERRREFWMQEVE